jgi:hypothetical protein
MEDGVLSYLEIREWEFQRAEEGQSINLKLSSAVIYFLSLEPTREATHHAILQAAI